MDKANAVYQTIVAALYSPKGARVLDSLSNPYIYRVFELSRATVSEAHHLKGFLRFSELQNGILFSTIHPKNNALPILAEHFTVVSWRKILLITEEPTSLRQSTAPERIICL